MMNTGLTYNTFCGFGLKLTAHDCFRVRYRSNDSILQVLHSDWCICNMLLDLTIYNLNKYWMSSALRTHDVFYWTFLITLDLGNEMTHVCL